MIEELALGCKVGPRQLSSLSNRDAATAFTLAENDKMAKISPIRPACPNNVFRATFPAMSCLLSELFLLRNCECFLSLCEDKSEDHSYGLAGFSTGSGACCRTRRSLQSVNVSFQVPYVGSSWPVVNGSTAVDKLVLGARCRKRESIDDRNHFFLVPQIKQVRNDHTDDCVRTDGLVPLLAMESQRKPSCGN